jgi:glycosyltransferase involved in cell wall biosynthesis
VALAVGRMATKKGFHVLVAALPRLLDSYPQLHVVLAGGGDRERDLRAAVSEWQQRVHFPGLVARDALPDLFRAADLFVMPAVHDARGNVDGLPNVVLEAMATGLPVVASAVSGLPLAIGHGVHGLLVPEGDATALGGAIEHLIGDAQLRARLGLAARQRAVTELSWDQVARAYRDHYARALEGAPALPEARTALGAHGTGGAGD